MKPTVTTQHGDFEITRKDCKVISVIRIRRPVKHYRQSWKAGDISHREHRKHPKVVARRAGWYEFLALYDLNGNELEVAVIG